jgi:hypothetical protein
MLPRHRAWRGSFKLPRRWVDLDLGRGLVLIHFELKRGRVFLPRLAPWHDSVFLPCRLVWRDNPG